MVSITPSAVLPLQSKIARIIPEKLMFRLRFAAQAIFGSLLIIDSLFLVLCYITFNFFGALNSPFFTWLRGLTFAAKLLYFPAFAAALVSIDLGWRKDLFRWIVAALIVTQVVLGMVLIWGPGMAFSYGWTL